MTIPFGRRRLVVSIALAGQHSPAPPLDLLPGATDAELARLAQGGGIGIDRARWDALVLMYGGRRP